jgi:hypothetical protein
MFIKHQLMHINFIHNSLLLKFPYTHFNSIQQEEKSFHQQTGIKFK